MQTKQVLRRLGLPGNLVALIRDGRLETAIAEAYARYDGLCTRLDAFEGERPEVAQRLPWFEAREAWKADGRPLPEWHEVLALFDWEYHRVPFRGRDAHLEWPRPPEAKARHREQSYRATKALRARQREARRQAQDD